MSQAWIDDNGCLIVNDAGEAVECDVCPQTNRTIPGCCEDLLPAELFCTIGGWTDRNCNQCDEIAGNYRLTKLEKSDAGVDCCVWGYWGGLLCTSGAINFYFSIVLAARFDAGTGKYWWDLVITIGDSDLSATFMKCGGGSAVYFNYSAATYSGENNNCLYSALELAKVGSDTHWLFTPPCQGSMPATATIHA